MAVLIRIVNIKGIVTPGANFAMLLERPGDSYIPVSLEWNCLGWQSLVPLGLTLAYYWNSVAAMIIHNYFAAFVALLWLIFFWWFVYSFVLEERRTAVRENVIKV